MVERVEVVSQVGTPAERAKNIAVRSGGSGGESVAPLPRRIVLARMFCHPVPPKAADKVEEALQVPA